MAIYKYSKLIDFDGIETTQDIDVSDNMADARNAIWTLYDILGSPVEGVVQPVSITTVRLTATPALAVGSYRLVGIA